MNKYMLYNVFNKSNILGFCLLLLCVSNIFSEDLGSDDCIFDVSNIMIIIEQESCRYCRMSDHEVTQSEFESVMGNNPSYFRGESLPVENVSWLDAIEYCNRRSEKEGFAPCYTINNKTHSVKWDKSANGYRLPLIKEWKIAFGDISSYKDTTVGEKTHIIKESESNSIGLYDMEGNVSEWCWGDNYNSPNPTSCGSSFADLPDLNILPHKKEYTNLKVGFRVVRNYHKNEQNRKNEEILLKAEQRERLRIEREKEREKQRKR